MRHLPAMRHLPESCSSTAALLAAVAVVLVLEAGGAAQPVPPEPEPAVAGDSEAMEAVQRELEGLRRRTSASDAQLQQLRRELQAERERASRAEASTRTTAEQHGAVLARVASLETAPILRAGRLGLSLGGFVQADAIAWRQSSVDEVNSASGEPLNETRFLLRRARLRIEADYRLLTGALELDANTVKGPQVRPVGAEVSLRWPPRGGEVPLVMVTLGSFKTPFGFEVVQSDRDRLFLERSNLARTFFPGEYDLGVRVQGGWRFVRWALAAMNGDPVGERLFPGRDPSESKDLVGRLGAETLIAGRVELAGGVSGVYGEGFSRGTPATKDTLVWRDTNENNVVDAGEIQSIPGQVAVASKSFRRFAVGGDLRAATTVPRLGRLLVYGELVWGSNLDRGLQLADPVAAGRDLRELGWYVGFTQELTRYGMIGLRYDRYNPDRDANDLRDGVQVPKDATLATLALAGAVRWAPYGRIVLEYDHQWNSLGRGLAGEPTTLADDAFTIRAEVTF